jgi:signal transduction histidine kinase/FixJ family two-component response regulator
LRRYYVKKSMSKPVVICIDDEPAILQSLKTELRRVLGEECTIETAEGGGEALDLLAELQRDRAEVALVLADYTMPGMKGDELLKQIHERSPQTLKIMLTGQADIVALGNAIRHAKLYRYIAKPWDSEELRFTVMEAVRTYRQDRYIEVQNSKLQATNRELEATVRHLRQLEMELQKSEAKLSLQLQTAYDSDATLKKITEKMRDSLDENQILQGAVEALAQSLKVGCCNAALFDLEQGTSTIRYEFAAAVPPSQGRVSVMSDFPEIYDQLLKGWHFQFCSLLPHPWRGQMSMLVCPIADDQGVLGDLWLVNQAGVWFDDREINLVQHVATQCAIALRQARLFQRSQAQVAELERLSQLKDDFLSTVSHELRSPLANIKMAIQMLEVTLTEEPYALVSEAVPKTELTPNAFLANNLANNKGRYLQILKDECQREISLVTNLLDLARLDAGTEALNPVNIDLIPWLNHISQPYRERAIAQQQQLEIVFDEKDLCLTTDPSYLERIVGELLNNACKYTPANGLITIEVKQSGMNQVMRVMNSGVEIPAEERDRIFDKFYRIPKHDPWKHGGTGLGLALVKRLTERIGATIEVGSGGQKTIFTICFA